MQTTVVIAAAGTYRAQSTSLKHANLRQNSSLQSSYYLISWHSDRVQSYCSVVQLGLLSAHKLPIGLPAQRVEGNCPVKILSSQPTHWELTLKLILRTLSHLTVNSQDDSHFELALSFP